MRVRNAVSRYFRRLFPSGSPQEITRVTCLRKYLETAFRTRIVNFYGASESLALGVETDPAEGMLLFDVS